MNFPHSGEPAFGGLGGGEAFLEKASDEIRATLEKGGEIVLSRLVEIVVKILEAAYLAGVWIVVDRRREEVVFSANFACPHCGYSITELEPRITVRTGVVSLPFAAANHFMPKNNISMEIELDPDLA